MAYRNPAFIARHLAAEVGASAITSSTAATGFGKERLIDYRLAQHFKFNAAAANQFVQVNMGSQKTVGRLVIPDGHNLSGAAYEVYGGESDPPVTLRASGTFGSGLIDISWTEASATRWRLLITTSGQWEFGELWFGRYRQTTTGPAPRWALPLYSPATVRSYTTREAVLVAGARRRRLALEHIALASTDLEIYDEVLANGVATPFYFYAPDDALSAPILMRLTDDGDREQDHPAPSVTGPTYSVKLRALEQTT